MLTSRKTYYDMNSKILRAIGYIFIAVCVIVTGYSIYLSISDQEDKEMEEAYDTNLKSLSVTDASGVREISDEASASEALEGSDSADTSDSAIPAAIPAANLGDDLDREVVVSTADDSDSDEPLGFDQVDENAVLYTEPS